MASDLLISPPVILDWTDGLWTATLRKNPKPDDKPKFGVTSLWMHSCEATPEYKAIEEAIKAAAIARFGHEKYASYVEERKFVSPFNIDIGSKGYDKTVFKFRVNSTSGANHPPGVFDARRRTADGKPVPITDHREIYPGVLVVMSYSVRAYGAVNGWDPGVALDMRGVLKIEDRDRLQRGGTDGSEFGGIAPPAAEPIDMAALLG